jgi:hypothetical protein
MYLYVYIYMYIYIYIYIHKHDVNRRDRKIPPNIYTYIYIYTYIDIKMISIIGIEIVGIYRQILIWNSRS